MTDLETLLEDADPSVRYAAYQAATTTRCEEGLKLSDRHWKLKMICYQHLNNRWEDAIKDSCSIIREQGYMRLGTEDDAVAYWEQALKDPCEDVRKSAYLHLNHRNYWEEAIDDSSSMIRDLAYTSLKDHWVNALSDESNTIKDNAINQLCAGLPDNYKQLFYFFDDRLKKLEENDND